MKYSQWFSCNKHKPVRAGEYQWRLNSKDKYPKLDYWDGRVWRAEVSQSIYDPIDQELGYWRGIFK
jgi:hypothetical protein